MFISMAVTIQSDTGTTEYDMIHTAYTGKSDMKKMETLTYMCIIVI